MGLGHGTGGIVGFECGRYIVGLAQGTGGIVGFEGGGGIVGFGDGCGGLEEVDVAGIADWKR